jgi:1,4-alpha-glucan branching enzyme
MAVVEYSDYLQSSFGRLIISSPLMDNISTEWFQIMMTTGSEMSNKADSEFLWWRDGIIYQIYPRSFADSNGDGIGDLNGITQKLDHIAALGVDAIWLSPINPSPMFDFGYDVSDYEDIDPVFGDLTDFDRLIEEAHRRHIRVVRISS